MFLSSLRLLRFYRERRKRTFTATLKEKSCLANQIEINWDVRISVIFQLRLYWVLLCRRWKKKEESWRNTMSAMCSNGVNTTKLRQFVGSYALHRWYFGMLVVTLVTTGKGGIPVLQWCNGNIPLYHSGLWDYILQPAAHCILFPQQLNLHMYTFTVSTHRHTLSCFCTQW